MTEDEVAAYYPLLGLNPNIMVEDEPEDQPVFTGILDQDGHPIVRFPPERIRMGFRPREEW